MKRKRIFLYVMLVLFKRDDLLAVTITMTSKDESLVMERCTFLQRKSRLHVVRYILGLLNRITMMDALFMHQSPTPHFLG